jgi:hypothetical protein
MNLQGQFHLDNILTHPSSKISPWTHRSFGKVIDVQIPGQGALDFIKMVILLDYWSRNVRE